MLQTFCGYDAAQIGARSTASTSRRPPEVMPFQTLAATHAPPARLHFTRPLSTSGQLSSRERLWRLLHAALQSHIHSQDHLRQTAFCARPVRFSTAAKNFHSQSSTTEIASAEVLSRGLHYLVNSQSYCTATNSLHLPGTCGETQRVF
ncbi:hypothetical protein BCR37DRAFT_375993 [Protomyces lactucae-debilis]|uniref:Uncharacterized protein n=1 Tax=Protomyces lactucae-debilis TaxID=2754530 RepID=A0A1Y2FWU7_PROLT|nr:uncharacterized protein BCR37DRAFT_375993 [Protomyces lactucae-debilis]ORY88007.1 hypothetical protein BCR37DRAFT_375993 [Protomyces lactucae-debilis]